MKLIWLISSGMITIFVSVATASWVASAYTTTQDNRINALEDVLERVPDRLSDVDKRLARMEGKIDVFIELKRR